MTSNENPFSPHSKIISSESDLFDKKQQEDISWEEKHLVLKILDDIIFNTNNISERLVKVRGFYIVTHPQGHQIFLEKKKEIQKAILFNNSRIDTSFRKIIPVRVNEDLDSLCMIGENGMVVMIKFGDCSTPLVDSFSCKSFNS